jgi:hypothetical protein
MASIIFSNIINNNKEPLLYRSDLSLLVNSYKIKSIYFVGQSSPYESSPQRRRRNTHRCFLSIVTISNVVYFAMIPSHDN